MEQAFSRNAQGLLASRSGASGGAVESGEPVTLGMFTYVRVGVNSA